MQNDGIEQIKSKDGSSKPTGQPRNFYKTKLELAKSLGNTRFNSALGGILYSTIVNTTNPLGFGWVLLPYILF